MLNGNGRFLAAVKQLAIYNLRKRGEPDFPNIQIAGSAGAVGEFDDPLLTATRSNNTARGRAAQPWGGNRNNKTNFNRIGQCCSCPWGWQNDCLAK
ncbi:hypothetical protein RMSM_00229 [Rhodopirellula maiorica SM1]|uniref:Uncharacterized protein n=1 Tax=Rhodopirellula maiorica SM1 TaxID=1265738 RepID=M5S5C5_9BACT|nr:hypothetical protein RMSM_00229 [Rhodopirellula maiorica SM1]